MTEKIDNIGMFPEFRRMAKLLEQFGCARVTISCGGFANFEMAIGTRGVAVFPDNSDELPRVSILQEEQGNRLRDILQGSLLLDLQSEINKGLEDGKSSI